MRTLLLRLFLGDVPWSFFSHSGLATSRFVSEPLPDHPFKELFSSRGVVNSLSTPMIIPEIEFGKVAVKMLFLAVLVNALHAALEYGEIVLSAIHVHGVVFWADVLSGPGRTSLPADRNTAGKSQSGILCQQRGGSE